MKALIAPNESFNFSWVSSWQKEGDIWIPLITEISNCHRVAQVEPDDKVFEVALPLYWISCPSNCVSDTFFFKDGQFYDKSEFNDIPEPIATIEVLP
jgi:hypothetical protein